jgi:hypothetical protein
MNPPVTSSRKSYGLIGVLIVTAIALSPVCRNEFTEWDDQQTIAANPNLNPPTLQGLINHWTKPHEALYVPATYTVWWLTAQIAQTNPPEGPSLNPWVFHSVNLLIHLWTTAMAYLVIRRLAGSDFAGGIGALVFGVHPVQVESVAWASGTKDVLCGALSLSAIYLECGISRWKRGAGFVVFILAFLAKPSAMVVPAMLVAIHWLWLHERLTDVLRRLWLWIFAVIPAVVVTALVQPTIHAQTSPIWSRPLVAMDAIAFYLFKLIAPFQLAIDYGRNPAHIMQTGQIWWTWIAPAIVLMISLRWRSKGPAIVLLFVCALAPVLGLVNFTFQSYSTVADHYLYLPMLAVGLLVAVIMRRSSARSLVIIPLLVLTMAILSFRQAGTWHDTRSVFEQVLRVNGRSALANTNLAVVAIRDRDDLTAKPLLEKAVVLNGDYGPARLNLAMVYLRAGDKARAKEQFEQLLRIYQMQRNADPKLVEQVKQAIEKLTSP